MKRPSLYIFIAVVVAFAAALNYLFGSPLGAWEAALRNIYQPLLGIPLILLVLAVVPLIFFARTKKDGER